jgi:rhodanese-related sulfurtransferase
MNCSAFKNTLRHPDGFLEIEPMSLSDQGPIRVIDVREPREFDGALGHIPGAELVPLATVAGRATEWSRNEPLLVVCRSGGRSGRAVRALRDLGFQCAVNLRGGMLSYRRAVGGA